MKRRKFLTAAEPLATAADAIKSKPDDATANETLGRYWALARGRWGVGLKYLAKTLCTVKLSRRVYPQAAGHELDSGIEGHGLECGHRPAPS